MLYRKLILFFAAFVSAAAVAADGESDASSVEFFHQAGAQRFELTPTLDFYRFNISFPDKSTQRADRETISAQAEYGFNDMLAAGLRVQFRYEEARDKNQSGATTSTTFMGGLMDPEIYLKGRYNLGMSNLRFGATFMFPLEKHKYNQEFNQNQATGGDQVTTPLGGWNLLPYVGWDITLGNNIMGAKIAYTVWRGTRDYDFSDNGSEHRKDGNVFFADLFYEYAFPNFSLGINTELENHEGSKFDSGSGSYADDHDSLAKLIVNLYCPYRVSENFTVIGKLNWDTWTSYHSDGVDDMSGVGFQLGTRFAF